MKLAILVSSGSFNGGCGIGRLNESGVKKNICLLAKYISSHAGTVAD